MNLYAYVGNDPVNSVDPSGMCTGSLISDSNGNCKGSGLVNPALAGAGTSVGRVPGAADNQKPGRDPSAAGAEASGQSPRNEDGGDIVVTANRPASMADPGQDIMLTQIVPPGFHLVKDQQNGGGRGSGPPGACQRAFNQCHSNAVTLYDRGKQQDSFELRQQCFIFRNQCDALVNRNQQNPLSGGFVTFPGRSGAVIIVPGFGPYYIPDTRGPR
jgi:hypothetical protein